MPSRLVAALLVGVGLSSGSYGADLTLKSETRTLSELNCAKEGADQLTIEGEVVLLHTEREHPSLPLDPEKEILISCGTMRFEPGSILKSDSNLRIVIDVILLGSVNIESTRGQTGWDAPSMRVPDLSKHVGTTGVGGFRGDDGRDATEFKDGSRGEVGGEGHAGGPGGPGQDGISGASGGDASNIHLTTRNIGPGLTLRLSAVGGEGGAGGRGGRGQDGGIGGQGGSGGMGGDAAYLHDAERGGDGGRGGVGGIGGTGGQGGKGGSGGAGGQAYFYIVEQGGLPQEAGTYIIDGGKGGYPGIGGPPGKGGKGGPGGFPGGGGAGQNLDPLVFVTMGAHRLVVDGVEVEWHGEGDMGNLGAWGDIGPDGRPGPIGEWGDTGPQGRGGQLFVGVVSIQDYSNYRSSLGL